MKSSKKTLQLVGATVFALSLLVPTVAHAEETAPPSQEVGEEYRATSASDAEFGYPQSLDSSASGAESVAAGVPFTGWVKAHLPHKSSGDASGHVSWYLTSGTNQKIPLSSTLKARDSWLTFRTMAGPTTKSVKAGGGSGKDAVARYECQNSVARDWYTYGQAYAPGAPDPFGVHASAATSVPCQGGLP